MDRQLDILFVHPGAAKAIYQDLAETYSAIESPSWSLLLAESCRTKGFGVAILDCDALRLSYTQAANIIFEQNPRVACFVVYGGNPNASTSNMEGAIAVAELVKQLNPNQLICVIGSHASALPHEVLSYNCVDFVSINEGVYTLHDLLQTDLYTEADLKKVRGLCWKLNGISTLNDNAEIVPQDRMDIDMPGYAWDLLPYNNKPLDLYRSHFWHAEFNHNMRTPFAAIYTSLGCKFRCNFCMINIVNRTSTKENTVSADSNIMRFWSPPLVMKWVEELVEKYDVETLRLLDEMFYLNKKYYEPILDGIIERGYGEKLRMWSYSRVDTVNERFLEKFRKGGIKWLALGLEAGNQVIRQEITKGSFKDISIREVCKTVREADINIIANYIFGFSNETEKHLQETLDLAIELNTEMANMYTTCPLPGSPLYIEAKQNGWKLPDSYAAYSFLGYETQPLPTNYLSASDVLRFRDNAFHQYMTRPEYLNMIGSRFGQEARNNIEELNKIKLKRKILGHAL